MDYSAELIKGVVTLLIAIVGAFVGAQLALHKHRREKLWEARHSAYENILRALADIHTWVEESYASAKLLPALNAPALADLSHRYHSARHSLWQYAKIGNLTISSASVDALESLLRDLESERMRAEDEPRDETIYDEVLSEHCEKLRAILGAHLPRIMSLAKADLS